MDPNAVEDLARSIASLGLQCAPTCVARGDEYHLVAGRHRLEALRKLGVKSILVRVVDFDDIEARMWAIAENLHRAELTTEQRYEQIAEYTRLTKEKRQEERQTARSAQSVLSDGRKAGPQHDERGDAAAARDLGLSRRQVQRAQDYAALPEEVKEKAIEEGVNPTKLLRVTKQVAAGAPENAAGRISVAQTARPLRDLTNISGGEFARWIKVTTPNDRPHVIQVLETAAVILREELQGKSAA